MTLYEMHNMLGYVISPKQKDQSVRSHLESAIYLSFLTIWDL